MGGVGSGEGGVGVEVQLERLEHHADGVDHLVEVGDDVPRGALLQPAERVLEVNVVPHNVERRVARVRLRAHPLVKWRARRLHRHMDSGRACVSL